MLWESQSTSEVSATAVSCPSANRELRVAWLPGLQAYDQAWDLQRKVHADRCADRCPDTLLLLEHRPVMTLGRGARSSNLTVPESVLRERDFDIVRTDRGGDVTYHGPGQLIGYLICDLKGLRCGVRRFVSDVEEGIIRAVARWGITARHDPPRTGVWVGTEKLASIGLRVSRWVTMHGLALNVSTDLRAFDLIVPCGIQGCRMTSMEQLTGATLEMRRAGQVVAEELAGLWNRSLVPVGEEDVNDRV